MRVLELGRQNIQGTSSDFMTIDNRHSVYNLPSALSSLVTRMRHTKHSATPKLYLPRYLRLGRCQCSDNVDVISGLNHSVTL